jgi:acyl-CoA synthetase (AMP-forming)/AMP-acid ligase II/acyl carrier protein
MSHALARPRAGCSTLVELLRQRALEAPDRVAYTFLKDGELDDTVELTYGQLDEQARAVAAWLQERGAAGERALLLYPPGLEFMAGFFGCLYAGVVAIPAYPPRSRRKDARLHEIVADAQATVALTTSAALSGLEALRAEDPVFGGLRWLATDDLPGALAAGWRAPGVTADTLAFLQYTSGSTVAPKGVMVTHANVLHTAEDLYLGTGIGEANISVSWLPHFHDMGLMSGVVTPVYRNYPIYVMPPASFLQRPARWLQAISRHRATHAGGPNFAYELCARKIAPEQRALLDLSSWIVAFSSAEPVRKQTLDLFAETFAPRGFRKEAFYPAYGLAEATVKVSGKRLGGPPTFQTVKAAELERHRVVAAREGDPGTRTLVGCGRGELDTRIVVVQPDTREACAPGEVGEIWVSSSNVAQGYWNRPRETEATFGARLASGEGPFLRTGDLGFLLDGELFVTGRLKELVIIRGLNHYPQDIERTVQGSHPALRPDAGAVFAVDRDEEESLVVVQEVDRLHRLPHVDGIVAAIRRAVTEEHEVSPDAVVLIRHGTILKTSSGKIQRGACRAAFLEGGLHVVGEWRSAEPTAGKTPAPPALAGVSAAKGPRSEQEITAWLIVRLSTESGIDSEEIDLGQPFAAFGLDSARALVLVGELETWLGQRLSPVVLWNYPTIEALARQLAAPARPSGAAAATPPPTP